MNHTKLLVIDDDVNLSEMLKLNLESFGPYEVRVANAGLEGFQAAVDFRPDLILLDVVMKDMDGRDVLNLIRADEHTRTIPVVFLTALAPESVMGIRSNQSYSGILSKPIDLDELMLFIEKNTGGSKAVA